MKLLKYALTGALILACSVSLLAKPVVKKAVKKTPPPAPAPAVQACDKPGTVSLAGDVILRFLAPYKGRSCFQRVDDTRDRIVECLSIGILRPKDIFVKSIKGEYVIFCKDIQVVTADKGTASLNKCSAKQLADAWCANLRKTLPESTPQKYIPK